MSNAGREAAAEAAGSFQIGDVRVLVVVVPVGGEVDAAAGLVRQWSGCPEQHPCKVVAHRGVRPLVEGHRLWASWARARAHAVVAVSDAPVGVDATDPDGPIPPRGWELADRATVGTTLDQHDGWRRREAVGKVLGIGLGHAGPLPRSVLAEVRVEDVDLPLVGPTAVAVHRAPRHAT